MRAILPLAVAGIVCGAIAATAIASPDNALGQRQMERWLAGKTPGEPQHCILLREVDGTSIIDNDTILYRVNRSTVYRNEIPGGCPGLQRDRSIVTRQLSDLRLCEGESFQVIDAQTGVDYGLCALGEFTPYE